VRTTEAARTEKRVAQIVAKQNPLPYQKMKHAKEEHTHFYQKIKTACLLIRFKIFDFVWQIHFTTKQKSCKYFF